MKTYLPKINWGVLGALICFFGGLLYLNLVSPVYQSTSRVVIFRNKVENPDNASDEARNRWIWIRDGLNVSSALVTDDLLQRFIEDVPLGKTATESYDGPVAKTKFLRSLIKIQFTGADENNYQIDVQSTNPELALELNRHIFNFLKYLSVTKDNEVFNKIIQSVHSQAGEFSANSAEYNYYQAKVMKLKFEHALAQVQRQSGFRVISYPYVDDKPLWPKPLALLIVLTIAGYLVGYTMVYLRKEKFQ